MPRLVLYMTPGAWRFAHPVVIYPLTVEHGHNRVPSKMLNNSEASVASYAKILHVP